MTPEKYQELKKLIESNKVEETLKKLGEFELQNEDEKERKIIYSRFNRNQKENRKGTIKQEDYNIESNQITSSLLDLIDKTKQKELDISNLPKETNINKKYLIFGFIIASIIIAVLYLFLTEESDKENNNSITSNVFKEDENKKEEETNLMLTDVDGNQYKTFIIDDKTWMNENLSTTKMNNGKSIPLVNDYDTWNELYSEAYCWYNNDLTVGKNKFGLLYNWYSVSNENLCPEGWHIPSDKEWESLSEYLDNLSSQQIKSLGIDIIPAGMRDSKDFQKRGHSGYYWSSWESSHPSTRHRWEMRNSPKLFGPINTGKNKGYSVRCVKN